VLFAVFAGSYAVYFAYLKHNANKDWRLNVDPTYSPHVSILIPAHNEESVIQAKLENLARVSYPKEKMEVILIDDASSDCTVERAREFLKEYPDVSVKILEQKERKGKVAALNSGLEVSSNDIVIVTDADSFWPSNILRTALPYSFDPSVGAISGRSLATEVNGSWVAKAEEGYLSFMSTLRLGESKVHSTIRFEGSFCIFKKGCFDEFDVESGADDSGTALQVVQNKYRAIFVPEAFAHTEFPDDLRMRMKVKVRRAVHLTSLWLHCLKLLLRGRLELPKRIAVPELFIQIFDPIVFVALVFATLLMAFYSPLMLIPIVLGLCVVVIIPRIRTFFLQGVFDQFILFYSILLRVNRKRILSWDK
jgi:cellulose synthase/poly-beta-1,6-N-acetylglucosamine synthase-like glycosyltransferase